MVNCPKSAETRPDNTPSPVTVNPAPGVSFVIRPFPPPSLIGVPIEYVVTQLRKLAPHYWTKTDTADCTIIVPVLTDNRYLSRRRSDGPFPALSRSLSSTYDPLTTGPFAHASSETAAGRRSSAPVTGDGVKKRMVVKLHRDYLSCQSTFFQAMFSGSSPLDLANPRIAKPTSKLAAGAFPIPPSAQPRLLPCAPNHPQLFLPLPDPSSFPHIVHYLYFGKISSIEEALASGSISWEGVVRNVEYLGMREDIKIFLGRWWGKWLDPTRHRAGSFGPRHHAIEEDSDGDDGGDEAEGNTPSPRPNPKARSRTPTTEASTSAS